MVVGSVAGALLHCSPIPVALAPRGYAEDPPAAITSLTAAVPTRAGDDNPLPFTLTLASAAGLPIRMVSLVSAADHADADSRRELRQMQIAAAEENLAVAARALPDAPDIDSLVADGSTLEAALKKLNWDESDVLVVGSSRVAAPKRVFLGTTAARKFWTIALPGAKYGIMTCHFYWLGAIPAMVFLGVFMMPFYYGSRARSGPEYLKLRFDERTR